MPDTQNLTHPCGKCAFYQKSVWQPVAPDAVNDLSHGFSRRELEAGQVLFAQEAENRGVFCVSKGLVALRSHHPDGSSTLLRLAYPGDVIGFRSFLGSGKHQTEARALVPSRICTVARREAKQVMRGNYPLLQGLVARCIAEIDRGHARIIASATISNKQRLADLLQGLIATHGERFGDTIKMRLPLSRTDLADLIGVQPETMSRLVKRLQRDGAFVFSGREVQVAAPLAGG
jgi:CRP-like cAMP-binding protein